MQLDRQTRTHAGYTTEEHEGASKDRKISENPKAEKNNFGPKRIVICQYVLFQSALFYVLPNLTTTATKYPPTPAHNPPKLMAYDPIWN